MASPDHEQAMTPDTPSAAAEIIKARRALGYKQFAAAAKIANAVAPESTGKTPPQTDASGDEKTPGSDTGKPS